MECSIGYANAACCGPGLRPGPQYAATQHCSIFFLFVLHWRSQCSKIPAGVPPAANMLLRSILLCTAGRRPAKQNEGYFFGL